VTLVTPAPATTLDAFTLPRADALTRAVLAAPSLPAGSTALGAEERGRLRDRLAVALSGPPLSTRSIRCLRIGAFQLGQALRGAGTVPVGGDSTFRWTARRARRTVGLAAVRACVAGRTPSPAEGVALVMADPDGPAGPGSGGPGSCAAWLSSLSRSARTIVCAEATTWATQLWTALDWRRIEPSPEVGPSDRWWEPAPGCGVVLRGRADVRVGAPHGPDVLLTMLGGHPQPTSRVELTLAALVDAVARPAETATSGVIGWWPECGKAWIVPIDAAGLTTTADAVVRAVRLLAGRSHRRAA